MREHVASTCNGSGPSDPACTSASEALAALELGFAASESMLALNGPLSFAFAQAAAACNELDSRCGNLCPSGIQVDNRYFNFTLSAVGSLASCETELAQQRQNSQLSINGNRDASVESTRASNGSADPTTTRDQTETSPLGRTSASGADDSARTSANTGYAMTVGASLTVGNVASGASHSECVPAWQVPAIWNAFVSPIIEINNATASQLADIINPNNHAPNDVVHQVVSELRDDSTTSVNTNVSGVNNTVTTAIGNTDVTAVLPPESTINLSAADSAFGCDDLL